MVFHGDVLAPKLILKRPKKVAVRARAKACESVCDRSVRAASRVPLTCRAHVHSFAGAKESEELFGKAFQASSCPRHKFRETLFEIWGDRRNSKDSMRFGGFRRVSKLRGGAENFRVSYFSARPHRDTIYDLCTCMRRTRPGCPTQDRERKPLNVYNTECQVTKGRAQRADKAPQPPGRMAARQRAKDAAFPRRSRGERAFPHGRGRVLFTLKWQASTHGAVATCFE